MAATAALIGGIAATELAGSGGTALAARSVPAYAQGLDVLPYPGTPDAAPGTNIDFPAVTPTQIASVKAVGSRSGLHNGTLSAQPDNNGTAFTPNHPFSAGEHVTVSAVMRTTTAAAASGSPATTRLHFTFSIGRAATDGPASSPPDVTFASSKGRVTHSFVTEPHFHVPIVTLSSKVPDPSQGDIFLDSQNANDHPGPYILDPKANLLYYNPTAPDSVFNLRVQKYNGRSVLTYWRGRIVGPGLGSGQDPIVNEHYKTIHTVTAGNGYKKRGTDEHEFTLGHEGKKGTAFVTISDPQQYNLTSVGGPPNGIVYDWIIQEIDIATNKVIWEWHALGHIPLTWSYAHYSPGQRYDFFHLNSIQQLSNGHIIISARNTFAVYAIDKHTGKTVWEVGGKHSTFHMGSGTSFSWQHHATLHNNGILTIFDDNNFGPASHGLKLHLNMRSNKATLVRAFFHKPNAYHALSQGSTQILADRNVFVGWGSSSHFTEFGPGGGQQFTGSFRGRVQSYRAYRFNDWVGKPTQAPAIAIKKAKTKGHVLIYVSWNGATRAKYWRVMGSSSQTGNFVRARSTVKWSSFETKIYVLASKGPYFKVVALDGKKKPLAHGTSPVVNLH